MKNILKFKLVTVAAFAFALLLIVACGSDDNAVNYIDISEEPVATDQKATIFYHDSLILAKVANLLKEEKSLGRLAQERFHNKDIKDLGAVMENEHQRILKDLNYLAEAKMILLTDVLTLDSVKNYTILNSKSGDEFDKEYCNMVIQKHLDVIELLERSMNESEDPDIRDWASSLLVEMRAHVELARVCEQRCKRASEKNGNDDISQHWDLAKTNF